MPRIVTTAEFLSGQALKDAEAYAARLKAIHAGLQTSFNQAASAAPPPLNTNALNQQTQQLQKAASEAARIGEELRVVQSRIAQVGVDKLDVSALGQYRREVEGLRQEAIKLRDAPLAPGESGADQAKYASLVIASTAALDKLAQAQRKFNEAGQDMNLPAFTTAAQEMDDAMTRLETNRRAGLGNIKAYRQELEQIKALSLARSNDDTRSDAERSLFARRANRAGALIGAEDTREANTYAQAVTRLKTLLLEEKITAEQASRAFTLLAEKAELAMRAHEAGTPIAGQYARTVAAATKEVKALAAQPPVPPTALQTAMERARGLKALMTVVKSEVSQIGLENMSTTGLDEALRKYQGIRTAAIALRDAVKDDARAQAEYAQVVTSSTNALDKLAAAQRGAAAKAGATPLAGGTGDKALTTLQKAKQQAQELKALMDIVQGEVSQIGRENMDPGGLDAARRKYEGLRTAAIALHDTVKDDARAQAEYAKVITATTAALDKLAQAQRGAAARAGAAPLGFGADGGTSANAPTHEELQIRAAQEARAKLAELNAQRRVGIITAERYEAEIKRVGAATRAEATATANSARVKREFALSADKAREALKRYRLEAISDGTGGSMPFALNSVAFGAGAIGGGAGVMLNDALKLNEEAKQAGLTLDATAKFYKTSTDEARAAVKKAAAELRQDEADVSQAMANLMRKSFSPEMARETIGRFSDAANAAGLKASDAIKAASEAILSEQSRQLNSAGIAENLGPELTKMQAAISKGENFFRGSFLTTDKARLAFENLRAQGKSFNEAAKGATLYQFVLKATDPVAGRTATSLNTLTGALDNYNVQWKAFKRGAVEGISVAAIPVLNTFSKVLGGFNNMPQVAKNTVGATAGIVALTLAGYALLAMGASLYLQQKKLIASWALEVGTTNFLSASYKKLTADVVVARLATTSLGASFTALNATALRLGATLSVGILGGLLAITAGAAMYAVQYQKATDKIYEDIEQAEKDRVAKLVATRGQAYSDGLNKLMTLMEVKGMVQDRVNNAETPEEVAAAQASLARVDDAINKQREYLRELNAKNKASKGDAAATAEQAEAYKNLLAQLNGVAERFGDMKLTTFQKDLRDAQKEQKKLLDEIAKGEKEYAESEQTRGLTPGQATTLRTRAAAVVPEAIAGLVAREQEAYRKAAVQGQLDMDRDRANVMKDGIAKRRALLAVERRAVQEDYRERIAQVRANRDDENITQEQRRVFAAEEVRLIAERNAKIKTLEFTTGEEIQKEREEQAKKAVETAQKSAELRLRLARQVADAELDVLAQTRTALAGQRDEALSKQTDPKARLALEQQYTAGVLNLTRQEIEGKAKLRRAEAERELKQALGDAAELSQGRAEAERLARQRYGTELRAAELERENALAQARVELEGRVQEARAAVVRDWVGDQLKGLSDVEGATVASLQRNLRAYLNYYKARGDAKSAEQVQEGLDRLDDEAEDRAKKVRDLLKDGEKAAGDFIGKVDELTGKAAKGMDGAAAGARKPFTDYAKQLAEEREKLEEARARLVNPDAQLTRDIDARLATLLAQERQVAALGQQAADNARRAFKVEDTEKAVKAAAKRAQELYDGGEGNRAAYRQALEWEKSYWTGRLIGMEKGTQQYEEAQARVEEIGRTMRELRLSDAQQPRREAQDALEALDAQIKLARTDAERLDLLAQRVTLLNDLAAAQARVAGSPDLKPSERAGARTAAVNAQADTAAGRLAVVEEQRRAAETLRGLAEAEVDYALSRARTEADITAAMKDRVMLAEQAVRDQDEYLANLVRQGATEEAIGAAAVERLNRLKTLDAARRDAARRGLALDQQRLDLLESEYRLQNAVQGVTGDSIAALGRQVTLNRARQALALRLLAVEGEGKLSDEERLAKQVELNNLKAEELDLARQIRQEEDRLVAASLSRARRQGLALTAGDPLATLQVERRALLNELADTDRRAARENVPLEERNELLTRQVELERELANNAREQRDAWEGLLDSLLGLTRGVRDLDQAAGPQTALTDYLRVVDRITRAREDLQTAERRALMASRDYQRDRTPENAGRLNDALKTLTGAVVESRDAIRAQAEEYRKSAQTVRSVTGSVMELTQRVNPKDTFTRDLLASRRTAALDAAKEAVRDVRAGGGDLKTLDGALKRLVETDGALRQELERLGQSDRYKDDGLGLLVQQLKPLARELDRAGTRDELTAERLDLAADRSALLLSGHIQDAAREIVAELAALRKEGFTVKDFDPSQKFIEVDGEIKLVAGELHGAADDLKGAAAALQGGAAALRTEPNKPADPQTGNPADNWTVARNWRAYAEGFTIFDGRLKEMLPTAELVGELRKVREGIAFADERGMTATAGLLRSKEATVLQQLRDAQAVIDKKIAALEAPPTTKPYDLAERLKGALTPLLTEPGAAGRPSTAGGPTPMSNHYETKVYVDGQPFPTVPSVEQLAREVAPLVTSALKDALRRQGVNC